MAFRPHLTMSLALSGYLEKAFAQQLCQRGTIEERIVFAGLSCPPARTNEEVIPKKCIVSKMRHQRCEARPAIICRPVNCPSLSAKTDVASERNRTADTLLRPRSVLRIFLDRQHVPGSNDDVQPNHVPRTGQTHGRVGPRIRPDEGSEHQAGNRGTKPPARKAESLNRA